MRRLLKKKVNIFGKEISVVLVGLLAVVMVSAALLSYYGQINQSVEIAQGVKFSGDGCVGNVCNETVQLNACESDESLEYILESQTSVNVPLQITNVVTPDGEGLTAETEFLLNADEIVYDGDGYIDADFEAGREYVTILLEGMTLADITPLVFEQYVSEGYPASVNILLDINEDGVFDSKKDLTTGLLTTGADDVLKIEWAHNPMTHYDRGPYYTVPGDYNNWFSVFKDLDEINGNTSAWLYSEAPGPGVAGCNFNKHTLDEWEAGESRGTTCCYVTNGWYNETCDAIAIDENTLVYGMQIESLGWITASESKVKNIKVNGIDVQPSLLPKDNLRFKVFREADCLTENGSIFTINTTATVKP